MSKKTQPKKTDDCAISDKELKKLKAEMVEDLAMIRHQILCRFSFIGNLMLRMDLVPVRDRRVRTACTNGREIYCDISFFKSLNPHEKMFTLAHELAHAMLLHLKRCQSRIPEIYNIASDMEANYMLHQQSANGDVACPENLCFPPKSMQGKSAEVIYEWLIKKFKQQKKNGQQMKIPNGSPSDVKSDSPCYGRPDEGEKSDDGSTDQSPTSHGNKTGRLEGQFDNHRFDSDANKNGEDDDAKGDDGGPVSDEWGEVGYDPDFNPKISKDFADRMKEAIIAEAQRCERTQGRLPAGLEGLLDKLPKPTIPWQEYLSQFVCSCLGDSRRWTPPARRHVYDEMYFQSRRSNKIKVCVLVDTSGSCWNDQNKFFSEMNSLLKTFGSYEMTVVQADADVQDITKYSDENPFPIDDPAAITVNGCGGSDFRPAFKAILEQGIEDSVDCIVCFTDGYIDFPKTAPSKPLLVILTNDGDKNCCEYGKKIMFEKISDLDD